MRSPSTSPVGAWGNRDVPGRHALRGGRVRRLPLRLVPRGDPGPGAPRAPASTSVASGSSTPAASGGDAPCGGRGAREERSRTLPSEPEPARHPRRPPHRVTAGARSPHCSGPRTRPSPPATWTPSRPRSPPVRTRVSSSPWGTPSTRSPPPVESRASRSRGAGVHRVHAPADIGSRRALPPHRPCSAAPHRPLPLSCLRSALAGATRAGRRTRSLQRRSAHRRPVAGGRAGADPPAVVRRADRRADHRPRRTTLGGRARSRCHSRRAGRRVRRRAEQRPRRSPHARRRHPAHDPDGAGRPGRASGRDATSRALASPSRCRGRRRC